MGQSHGSQQIELNTFLPLADVTCTGLFLSEALHTAVLDAAHVHKLLVAGTAVRWTFCWRALAHHSSIVDQHVTMLVAAQEGLGELVK